MIIPCITNGAQSKCDVAELNGPPTQGTPCQQTDGQNSLSIGATVGAVNGQIRSVVDVNLVDTGVNNVVNSTTVASQLIPVGWLYVDNNGGFWFQEDPMANWTVSLNFNINSSFGLGITPPPAKAPYPVAKPMSTPISNNIVVSKCWKQGQGLTPGAWG